MQATWLGFLNGAEIPYEPKVDSQLHRIGFLEGDPFRSSDGHQSISLDVFRSATWHLSIGDPGNLGRLDRRSAASAALDRASPDAFVEWWALLQPLVESQLSDAERARRQARR